MVFELFLRLWEKITGISCPLSPQIRQFIAHMCSKFSGFCLLCRADVWLNILLMENVPVSRRNTQRLPQRASGTINNSCETKTRAETSFAPGKDLDEKIREEVALISEAVGLNLQFFWTNGEPSRGNNLSSLGHCSVFREQVIPEVIHSRKSRSCYSGRGCVCGIWPIMRAGVVVGLLSASGGIRPTSKNQPPVPKDPTEITCRVLGSWKSRPTDSKAMSPHRWTTLKTIFARTARELGGMVMAWHPADLPPEEKARQWMQENCDRKISLAEIALHAGVSRQSLNRRWHKLYEETLWTSFLRMRAQHAADLMRLNPDHKLIEVAFDSGFGSVAQFNRVFKRFFGNSPHHYKEIFNQT
jgi:AraC-like DNA-binding protein